MGNSQKYKDSKKKETLIRRAKDIAAIFLAVWFISTVTTFFLSPVPKEYSIIEFAQQVEEGKVKSIKEDQANRKITVIYNDKTTATVPYDRTATLIEQLSLLGVPQEQLRLLKIEVQPTHWTLISRFADQAGESLLNVLTFAVSGILIYLVYKMTNKDEQLSSMNHAQGEVPTVTFKDVAGIEEVVTEFRDVINFFNGETSFEKVGARVPKGILLIGDPGTGKTLIAKAVAGEAGVPFFSLSGSEFVEMFVGLGASRVRKLFKKAKAKAPCIIFIDELDALGRQRGIGSSSADDEKNQTLNELLVQMDGFRSDTNVIVLAATNRPDVLDSALVRPGRFDRRIIVPHPDVEGRKKILAVHIGNKPMGKSVDLMDIAKTTTGMVGADLANLANEAAIIAARRNADAIEQTDFEEALEKILTGSVQNKSSLLSERERQIVAYHEAGHAVVMHSLALADPVYKISIVSRGNAGGFTMSLPEQERTLLSREKLLSDIASLLGGRAAEELIFNDVTSGASNDLQVATHMAESMVMTLGMSSAGLRVFNGDRSPMALAMTDTQTADLVNTEINRVLEDSYLKAQNILTEKQEKLHQVARELLQTETMNKQRFVEIMETK